MANIYPSTFPNEAESANPEYEVFETLRLLPDKYSVFYSKKFKGGKRSKEECEVDFIVFDGSCSLLIIEVKGGLIEYEGSQDCWIQNGKPLKTGPERQASANAHSLIEFLGSLIDNINVGWCVCFPNCSLPNNIAVPSGLPKAIIIDEAGMLEIDKAVGLVETYCKRQFKRTGCSSKVAKELRATLTRGIGFIQKIGVRIAKDRQQLIEVTEEQMQVLDDLMVNHRMAVRGIAGSGKTLIAQEFAKRLAADGKSVLLLFFNRMVANAVRYGLPRDLPIECTTFHSFARKLISETDPDWWNAHKSTDDDFWNVRVPLKLIDVPVDPNSRYDAVIVDEGQDFKKNWYEVLNAFLKDPDDGRFVVFYDEHQDIFGHWDDLPWGTNNIPRKVLSRNCRNTKSIITFLSKIQSCDMLPFDRSPSGEKVVERVASSTEQEQRQLVKDVKALLAEGITPGQIMLILNQPRADSCIANLDQIGKFKIESIGRTFRTCNNHFQYTNIRMFKGLEADVVLLLGVPTHMNGEQELQFYTQASRARLLLNVYRRTDPTVNQV